MVECFRRNADGNWVSQTYEQGQEVSFYSIGFTCAIADLYEAVP
ncbi:hypothetical protein MiSe_58150 [Microseira wollei NIES-4236]|uniref:Uncharacterized protein n=1 Tax=Microseira wollei NIES-4236 TaxID=2530354 RepID=A0AAV3XEL1_9CYAN|nr:hypothetical protein MiSe_58150 [Microseira wollei NIES-4236]